jgi:hypothetical protein
MKPGDVVFFRKAKRSVHRRSPEIGFAGHAFGFLLGEVPMFAGDPSVRSIDRCLGSIGLVKFDDVAEFLGAEAGLECVKKFEQKYYPIPKLVEAEEPKPEEKTEERIDEPTL